MRTARAATGVLVTSIVLTAVAISAGADDGHVLAYKADPDSPVRWRQTTRNESSSGGATFVADDATVFTAMSRPREDGEAGAELEVSLHEAIVRVTQDGREAMRMTMDRNGIVQNGTSVTAESSPPLKAMLDAMFGDPMCRIVVAADGAVDGWTALQDKPDGSGKTMPNMSRNFALALPTLPPDGTPVAVGATWKGRRERVQNLKTEGVSTTIELEYELASVADGVATITAVGHWKATDIVVTDPRGIMELMGASSPVPDEVKIESFEFTLRGTYRFSIAKGQALGAELEGVTKMRVGEKDSIREIGGSLAGSLERAD